MGTSQYRSGLRRLCGWWDMLCFVGLNVWLVGSHAADAAPASDHATTLAWSATLLGAASVAVPVGATVLGQRAAASDEANDWHLATLVVTGLSLLVLRLSPGLLAMGL